MRAEPCQSLWLLGHNLAVFPNVNRCSVHARHFSGGYGRRPAFHDRHPAAKLSGFLGGLCRVVMVRAPAISVWIQNSHTLPNDSPGTELASEWLGE
jgi:hypothetical protein